MIFRIAVCLLFAFDDCRSINNEDKLDWWRKSVIYQIYPRSFKDGNADGIGDLRGIEEQLEYFKELGINNIWLSPIYKSPMYDMGYDVSNFTDIDPLFGTMYDFDSLVAKIKSIDMKIILDFVPNHSSDECEWFKKSIKKIDPYTDYYVWRNPKTWTNNGTVPVPPNNWISVFEGSAWEYNEERKQFFLHEFSVKQPDLNYRSPAVVEEIKNILRFWLDKGVDGFRVDSVMYFYEHANFPDEPEISNLTINGQPAYYSLDHIHTNNLPETYKVAAEFRKLLDTYTKKDGHTRLLLTEAYTDLEHTLKYYGTKQEPIAHIPFNFKLLGLNYTSPAQDFEATISSWINNIPEENFPNWVLGNHDNPRITTRFDSEMVDALNMLLLLLPGVAITYQGEEIGMKDTKIRWDETTDVIALNLNNPQLYSTVSRDPERTPFQWNSSSHAGFSRINGSTWLPVNSNYYILNVQIQKNNVRSYYNVYKKLLKLRTNEVIQMGEFDMKVVSEWVMAFRRSLPGEETYIVVINLNNQEAYVNLNVSFGNLPSTMNVFIPSCNSEYNFGDKVDTNEIGFKMRPNSAVVLQAPVLRESHASLTNSSSTTRHQFVSIGFFSILYRPLLKLLFQHH